MSRMSFRKLSALYRNWFNPVSPVPPYSHICQIGDPILRYVTAKVNPSEIQTPEIQHVIKKLRHVMRRYDAVGLAAPQIGMPLRIFAIEFSESKRKDFSPETYKIQEMKTIPFTVFINPELQVVNYDKVQFPEACESVRGFVAEVPRYKEVCITGLNEEGKSISLQVAGWPARIVQHEMDHLHGKLFTDTMLRSSLKCSCWEKVNHHAGRIEIPFVPR